VYEAVLGGPGNTLQTLRPYATGLRNSMALAWVDTAPGEGALLQGENSIDYPAENTPPEELNLLRPGADYGWPACVGAKQRARGYEKAGPGCARTEAPLALWPAHAAPLQLLAVPATSPSPWRGQVLVVWHGYRAAGHRVMAFRLAAPGQVQAEPQAVLSGWAAQPGVRPLGAPTGITIDSAGRLWVVEDRNRSLLLVQRDPAP
jgi:glucose/arabinose dehydrogenase